MFYLVIINLKWLGSGSETRILLFTIFHVIMGISGLLPFVKPASSEKHVSNFKGQTAAIDSYCWLHRGAFGCAEKIVRGEATNG